MIFARLQGQHYCNILCNNVLTRIIAPYCRTEYCNILIDCYSPSTDQYTDTCTYEYMYTRNIRMYVHILNTHIRR